LLPPLLYGNYLINSYQDYYSCKLVFFENHKRFYLFRPVQVRDPEVDPRTYEIAVLATLKCPGNYKLAKGIEE